MKLSRHTGDCHAWAVSLMHLLIQPQNIFMEIIHL